MKRGGIADDDDLDDLLELQTNRSEANIMVSRGDHHGGAAVAKVVPLQAAFQPASTPKHLEHRYLVWNGVGLVRAHTSNSENSIEVDFHDASVHHGIHMSNYLNHTMASLSTTVLALAGETPSKLVCIALGAGSREWSVAMPDCEEIQALVATDKLVAVATDSGFIRFYSVMGNQREVISLPGPVLAMAGYGDKVIVVYHSAPASLSSDQHLSAMVVQAIGLGVRCREVRVPINSGARLAWLGCTDRGSPVFADSKGIVQLFNSKGSFWMPVCDTNVHVTHIRRWLK